MSYPSVPEGNTHHPERFSSRALIAIRYVALALLLTIAADVRTVLGQSLNWDGQTGVFVTPLAYTAASSKDGFGKPIVSFHFLNGGKVLGNFYQSSITEGALGRIEFGYTRDFHAQGSTAGLSNLWGNGFNSFHGKVNFLPENLAKQKWVPAISAGFVARTQVYNVGGWIEGRRTNNADFYVVATKTITETKKLPIVLNAGYKVTNHHHLRRPRCPAGGEEVQHRLWCGPGRRPNHAGCQSLCAAPICARHFLRSLVVLVEMWASPGLLGLVCLHTD